MTAARSRHAQLSALVRTYADGTTEQFVYHGPSLASKTDRQGRIQKYDYNSRNQIAGSAVTYNGLQIATEQLLGISGGTRFNRYGYDARSRLVSSVAAKEIVAPEDLETLTSADFRKAVDRVATTPVDPPSLSFTESDKGHKIAQFARGGEVRTFTYNGSERRDDGRYVYDFDDRGRLIRVTEKLTATSLSIRRMTYVYNGNDRLVGRTAEYANLSRVGTPPIDSDWKTEDRNDILAADGLPASTTFVWDPISDTLVAIFSSDGTLIRQILHGGLGYDDPLEITIAGADGGLSRLYPLYDESGNGSLTAILNANGEIVSRNLSSGAYGEEEVAIGGSAVDHVDVKATKDTTGAIASVDVSIRTTEAIKASSLAGGIQLAAVTSSGTLVRKATATPTLSDAWTANIHLTASDWTTLTSTAGGATALSVAVTSTLRADGLGDIPVLPAPDWAKATEPIYSSPTLPVEIRESLTTLTATIAAIAPNTTAETTLYDVPSLAALGAHETFGSGSTAADAARLLVTATFQAHPFQEPFTGQDYVRARWYDPASGSWLTPDAMGYRDSSNLYAYAGGDPVNQRDSTGMYEEDVHHWLTVFLARAAGFDDETSQLIGWHTEQLDRDERDAQTGATHHVGPYDLSLPFNSENMDNFHMVSPEQLEFLRATAARSAKQHWLDDPADAHTGNPAVDRAWQGRLHRSLKWRAIGEYLHALEDSYAHQAGVNDRDFSLTFGDVIGHGLHGHRPDWTWKRQALAYKMAINTYQALQALCVDTGHCGTGHSWSDIHGTVWAFIAYKPHGEEMSRQAVFGTFSIENVKSYRTKVGILDPQFLGEKSFSQEETDRLRSSQTYQEWDANCRLDLESQ